MGRHSARAVSRVLDRFLEHYYRRRPVNATFTGVHDYDALLPDWSPEGLAKLNHEIRELHADLETAHPAGSSGDYRTDLDRLDAELARAFLEIQLAENGATHGMRGNPALWTGEAVFSIVSLMIRDFAPLGDRVRSAAARLEAIPAFLGQAAATLGESGIPAAWTAKALRECEGATILLDVGLAVWLSSPEVAPPLHASARVAASRARVAFERFAALIRRRAVAPELAMSCGPELFDLLLARGHQSTQSRADLLADARRRMVEEQRRLEAMAKETAGSWEDALAQLAAEHPTPDGYLSAFQKTWADCHRLATEQDVVTWEDWPIRYAPIPPQTRDAAPFLYYLFYRSPAPFDPYTVHDYVVAPLPTDDVERHLRAWNDSVIKLNHVVHHGAIGHHVQNWHAYHRAPSRVGRIAAVDCASRIGMFAGGTMAEGWACYATGLMEELGFLTPLERLSEQHSRVRFLARAIVDIELHQRTMSFDDAKRFYAEQVGMDPNVAHAETVKNSMFPCTALMYWLGTQTILDLRDELRRARGEAFSLKAFHDELLGHGSLPVPLVARMMTDGR
jgi:hypothetical protein